MSTSKILLIIATVLLIAASVLGFLTRNKIIGLHQEIASLNDTVTRKQAQIVKLEGDLKSTQDELASTKAKLDQTSADLATARQQLDKSKTDLAAALADVETKNAEIAKLNEEIAKIPTTAGGESPAEAIAGMQAKLAETESQLTEAKQAAESLTSRNAEIESQMTVLKEKEDRRDRQIMAQNLEAQVLAVNQAWNFVVLSIGDRQGAVPNAEMIVVRDGKMIGKVKITSVEPSTSIADVIPGSVPKGMRVQPGDRVIYKGA